MNTKVMIAMYRYRVAVSKGENAALAVVHAAESVASTQSEYIKIYAAMKASI